MERPTHECQSISVWWRRWRLRKALLKGWRICVTVFKDILAFNIHMPFHSIIFRTFQGTMVRVAHRWPRACHFDSHKTQLFLTHIPHYIDPIRPLSRNFPPKTPNWPRKCIWKQSELIGYSLIPYLNLFLYIICIGVMKTQTRFQCNLPEYLWFFLKYIIFYTFLSVSVFYCSGTKRAPKPKYENFDISYD